MKTDLLWLFAAVGLITSAGAAPADHLHERHLLPPVATVPAPAGGVTVVPYCCYGQAAPIYPTYLPNPTYPPIPGTAGYYAVYGYAPAGQYLVVVQVGMNNTVAIGPNASAAQGQNAVAVSGTQTVTLAMTDLQRQLAELQTRLDAALRPPQPGLAGPAGATGPRGPAGPAGIQGEPGKEGRVGPTGPEGKQGVPGPQGKQGPPGPEGKQGLSGAEGKQWPPGPVTPLTVTTTTRVEPAKPETAPPPKTADPPK